MYYRSIMRFVGISIIFFSIIMIIPIIISLIYFDNSAQTFILSFFVTFLFGFFLWWINKSEKKKLNCRTSLLLVILFWIILGSIGAIPFFLSPVLHLSLTNALFESFSGFTTTGTTILIRLDDLPKSILFYRQMLQWFGGIGIIVLFVAILPTLGVGGIQLYQAEIPGPVKDNKVKPRITETAKTLLLIYVLLTIVCAIFLWLAGMSIFDALSHSFSTISVGGFSTHDSSISYFHNFKINIVISIFLLLSSCNYSLHFLFLSGRNYRIYWSNLEFRFFVYFQLFLFLTTILIITVFNCFYSDKSISYDSLFQVISISTTAGFTISNMTMWPSFLFLLLVFSAFIGGCSGSISGGIKILRFLLSFKHAVRELNRLIHPHALYNIKFNNEIISYRLLDSIFGFLFIYFCIFFISTFILILTGVDKTSAFLAILSTLNNLGFDLMSSDCKSITTFAKWVLIVTMLFGRLEFFTLIVLLTPSFWRESF